ncbi:hypothetical protein EZL74_04745 [Flavobacterium silvisoli]|uniref:DUF6265 domain-containing protein n=1 Tax=Flavobacterium silvisoli TaxID=2529433 RepID=A0A4Q9Z166_9FLAO|nr:DUF6265 family protein [Flavobacterium silvisoli]TBX70056.1 hypothetical protein EZL74_04745 [Flavobacterium silvisoli]
MKIITCSAVVLLLVSCQKKSEKNFDKLEKMNWLVGQWENKMPEGLLVENWKKENDSTFSGSSYFINAKDTVHFESIRLTQKEEDLIYTATVTGQNDDQPVDFKLTSDNANSFTFENPAHDYPQKITYKKVDQNNLTATISGKQQGKESQESYPMKRK